MSTYLFVIAGHPEYTQQQYTPVFNPTTRYQLDDRIDVTEHWTRFVNFVKEGARAAAEA